MKSTPQNRIKLWSALSDLFLDTEISEHTYRYIARVIREDGYTVEEAEHVLWQEVYPVLEANLNSIVGEWAGWSEEWLIEHIKISTEAGERAGVLGDARIIEEIRSCWGKVKAQLRADARLQK